MLPAKDNADNLGRKHAHRTKGGAGGKDLNYLTVMEEGKPTKLQGRDLPDLSKMLLIK